MNTDYGARARPRPDTSLCTDCASADLGTNRANRCKEFQRAGSGAEWTIPQCPSVADSIRVEACHILWRLVGYAYPRRFRTDEYMRGISTKSRVVVQKACRDEVDLLVPVGVRGRASASFAEAGMPTLLARNVESSDIVFATQPAETRFRCIENGIAIGA